MRKNRSNFQFLSEKASIELIEGWIWSKKISYSRKYSSGNVMSLFLSSHDSSLFRKSDGKFTNFDDYVIVDDVIGHDVTGHPEVSTDNTGLGLYGIENRLLIHGPH